LGQTEDEIGILSKAFNQMTVDSKKSREKIEEYSKTLKQKVVGRTKDLQDALNKLKNTQA